MAALAWKVEARRWASIPPVLYFWRAGVQAHVAVVLPVVEKGRNSFYQPPWEDVVELFVSLVADQDEVDLLGRVAKSPKISR